MSLARDAEVAHYRIVRRLAAGGMGEVYEAHDTTLDRPVALKILPRELTADDERVRRFVQEARSASGLSHPHIVTIHEIGEAAVADEPGEKGEAAGSPLPVRYIAMELVDGPTLRREIHEDRAPLRDLLRWLAQAADGLAKAHAAGIVHRDLKPDNVMITGDGFAKVLDFGLAKLALPPSQGTQAPTATGAGAMLGTVGYMAPEQVRGEEVDARADVFSLGCVLYEVATRRKPFAADTTVDTLHQILHDPPPAISQVAPDTPPALQRVVRRCLAKDPGRRYQSMKDLALELSDLADEMAEWSASRDRAAAELAGAQARAPRPGIGWGAVAATGWLVAAGLAWFTVRPAGETGAEQRTGPLPTRFTQMTDAAGMEVEPSLSPDGSYLVYAGEEGGDADLFLLRIGGRNPINLTADSAADEYSPTFSPDGQRIAFVSDREGGGVFVMGATGEATRRLADHGFGPSWSPDGHRIVFAAEGVAEPTNRNSVSPLEVVEVESGAVRKIYDGDAVQPRWSPDGGRIAFWGLPEANSGWRDVGTIPATGGDPVWIARDAALDWGPAWAPDGRSLYFLSDRGGSMNAWRVGIDPATGAVTGDPEPLTLPARASRDLTLSADGRRLAFSAVENRSNIASVVLDPGGMGIERGPIEVTRGSRNFAEPSVSPDDQWLVLRSQQPQEDLMIGRPDGGGLRKLTDDAAKDRGPSWWPDSSRIVFYSDRGGRYEIWAVRTDGSGLEQITRTTGRTLWFPRVSPDGRWMAAFNETGSFLVDLSGPFPAEAITPLPPLGEGEGIFQAHSWSPDGRQLAGLAVPLPGSTAPATLRVYDLESHRYRVVGEPGDELGQPEWLPGGQALLYGSGEKLLRTELETGATATLGQLPTDVDNAVALSADGRRVFLTRRQREADVWLASFE